MQHSKVIEELFSNSRIREYEKGQILLYQGEKTQEVFFIKRGHVKVYDVTSQGAEKLIMILGPGDIFPVVWTFGLSDDIRYFYETYDPAAIQVIARQTLLDEIEKSHKLSKHLLKHFANRTSELMKRIDCIEATSAKHKVAQVLAYLASAHGDEVAKDSYVVRIPITHQAIADMSGINRATASIHMKELEEEKMFKDTTSSKGLIVHLDRVSFFLEQD